MKPLRLVGPALMACLMLLGLAGLAAADPTPTPSPPPSTSQLPQTGNYGIDPCAGLEGRMIPVVPAGTDPRPAMQDFYRPSSAQLPAGHWVVVGGVQDHEIQLCGEQAISRQTSTSWLPGVGGIVLGCIVGAIVMMALFIWGAFKVWSRT